jgi:peptidoglycan-associated lipoprotein
MKTFLLTLLRLSCIALLVGLTGCRGGGDDGAASGISGDLYGDLPPITEFDSDFDGTELPAGRGGIGDMTAVDSSALMPVYFGFDSHTVSSGEMSNISAAVSTLMGDPSLAVILQGHTDERGSREYNLALGERRALAVRDVLMTMGVTADRIQTLSYGEEMPAVNGFDENAWSANRRVEFQLMR